MSKILVTGGTGVIGSELVPKLIGAGHSVRVLSRTKQPVPGAEVYTWDVSSGFIQEGALEGVDQIIHLAGFSTF